MQQPFQQPPPVGGTGGIYGNMLAGQYQEQPPLFQQQQQQQPPPSQPGGLNAMVNQQPMPPNPGNMQFSGGPQQPQQPAVGVPPNPQVYQPTQQAASSLPTCKFGTGCTRRNPQHWAGEVHPPICKYAPACTDSSSTHRAQYSHPPEEALQAIRDAVAQNPACIGRRGSTTGPTQQQSSQSLHATGPCQYGATCSRKNPRHWSTTPHPPICPNANQCQDSSAAHVAQYSHPPSSALNAIIVAVAANPSAVLPLQQGPPRCPGGARCTNSNEDHWKDLQHPTVCKFHPHCTDRNPGHRGKYSHPPTRCAEGARCQEADPNHWLDFKHPHVCRYGQSCHDTSDAHRDQYSHPPTLGGGSGGGSGTKGFLNNSLSGSTNASSPSSSAPPMNTPPPYWKNDPKIRKVEITHSEPELVRNIKETFKHCISHDNLRPRVEDLGKPYHELEVKRVWRVENANRWYLYQLKRQVNIDDDNVCKDLDVKSASQWMNTTHCNLDTSRGEFYLFHGTAPELVDVLVEKGFNEKFSNPAGLYGAGTYFGEDPAKCDQYVTSDDDLQYFMFMARVTLGKPYRSKVLLRNILQAPGPATPEGKELGVNTAYDSVVSYKRPDLDDGKWFNFREFIIYHGDLAYPEFIVQYERVYK